MSDNKNNLEQQLAGKLGNRSIAPSAMAWERVARNRQQGKASHKKKKAVLYYYVASVVLLLSGAGYYFMRPEKDVLPVPQVVNAETEKPVEDKAPATVQEQEPLQQAARAKAVAYKEEETEAVVPGTPKEAVKAMALHPKAIMPNQSPFADTAVAVVPLNKAVNKNRLYEDEANYLLKHAIMEVAADKELNKPTSDTALLREVEAEMDDYYREKAMHFFSLKNKTIRIAVRDKQ